jgi:hypothetical protein
MEIDIAQLLIGLVINIIIWVIAAVPALWISGRLLAGKQNAKFTDALWIVIIGTVIFYFINWSITTFAPDIFNSLLASLIAYFILLIIWLALVKHFFDCGWLKALAISIIAVIIAIVIWLIIGFIFALIGIGAGWIPDPTQIFNNI